MFSEDGYRALTTGAGVVRRGDRGVLEVQGADRLTWLQGLVTNDVMALPERGVAYAAYLTAQGRMITDMRVVNLADRTLLDVPATLAASLQARLDALLFSEDAAITDRSGDLSMVDIHGPLAPAIVDGRDVVRDDVFDLPGYSAFVPPREVADFVEQLVARGAVETSLETLDTLRIEAGRPAFVIDMDEHTIPLEAGIEQRAISFSKGCYIGQEVIVRVTHRGGGRVARKLVGLRIVHGESPKAGAAIQLRDRVIGRLTSVTWSPSLAAVVGLGYVHRDFVEPGTGVEIAGPDGSIPATVTALPFVSREARPSLRS